MVTSKTIHEKQQSKKAKVRGISSLKNCREQRVWRNNIERAEVQKARKLKKVEISKFTSLKKQKPKKTKVKSKKLEKEEA